MVQSIISNPAACEKIPTSIFKDAGEASLLLARDIADLIRQRAAEGSRTVLGLATGSTPTSVYNELVRMHKTRTAKLPERRYVQS